MNILALETATSLCSVALRNETQCFMQTFTSPRQHEQPLLEIISSVLAQAKITLAQVHLLAYSQGPGSFTGLRVTTAMIQAFSYVHSLPIVAIGTLRAIAQAAFLQAACTQCLVALDARMNQIYTGRFNLNDEKIMCEVDQEKLCTPQDLTLPKDWHGIGVGDGFKHYTNLIPPTVGSQLTKLLTEPLPLATAVAEIAIAQFKTGQIQSAHEVEPLYLNTPKYLQVNPGKH